MAFTAEKVKHLAYLTKVALTDGEEQTLTQDLDETMQWLDALKTVDTAGVAPLHSVMEIPLYLRPDAVDEGGIAQTVTAQAPERAGTFYVVPKVLEA